MPATFDLRGASLSKQTVLEASYSGIRAPTQHPGNIGDEAEADWVEIPRDFLPNRYQVGPIFAVDHTGACSDQIDPAIYDRQYSPQRFGTHEGVRFVPAENVYAAFEVKPDLTAEHLTYAQNKITSVATSSGLPPRSSTPGGKFGAINPDFKPIIGGILTTRTGLGRTRCHHRPAQPGLRGVIVGGYGCSYEPLNCKNAKPGSRWVPGLAHAWHNRAKEGAPSRLLLCTMATELLGIAPSALLDDVELGGVAALLGEAGPSGNTLSLPPGPGAVASRHACGVQDRRVCTVVVRRP